jgi:hypothetical protein
LESASAAGGRRPVAPDAGVCGIATPALGTTGVIVNGGVPEGPLDDVAVTSIARMPIT